MRILILCGFAGSGKTTLLLQMARYLSQHPGPQTVETVMEDIRMFHQDVRCFPVSALHAVDGEIWKQVEEAGL